jgi:hypothetical protein
MQEADYSGYEGYVDNKYFTKMKPTKAWEISLFFLYGKQIENYIKSLVSAH